MDTASKKVEILSPDKGQFGDLDSYFEFAFGGLRPAMMPGDEGWRPAADMFETETHIVLVIDISGISVKDVELTLQRDLLILKGARQEKDAPRRQYHLMEVTYGPFERTFRLPAVVCADTVSAEYRNGMLTVNLEKRPSKVKIKRRIHIQQG